MERSAAREVGVLLAAACVVVLCGEGSGVMAAVVDGVRSAGGLVIDIRPVTTSTTEEAARGALAP